MAHLLRERTPRGSRADDETWARAVEAAGRWLDDDFEQVRLRRSEVDRRPVTAIALARDTLYSERTLNRVELARTGAGRAAQRLIEIGDVERDEASPTGPRLIDPLLERWVGGGAKWPE